MALEKTIIKSTVAQKTTFDYQPRELNLGASEVATSFTHGDEFKGKDFKLSELIAQQTGISKLESDAYKDRINTAVLEQIKDIQEKAYKEGYELGQIEGTQKAFDESRQDLSEKLKSLQTLLESIEAMKTKLLATNEAHLIRLVFQIAKKIALRDLESHREAIVDLLTMVVQDLQTDERITIKLSHEDVYFIESLKEKIGEKIEHADRLKIVGDDHVRSGGCLVETSFGSVNATVDERLERIWQTLAAKQPKV
jgi:flagellar assembly protein FliH